MTCKSAFVPSDNVLQVRVVYRAGTVAKVVYRAGTVAREVSHRGTVTAEVVYLL